MLISELLLRVLLAYFMFSLHHVSNDKTRMLLTTTKYSLTHHSHTHTSFFLSLLCPSSIGTFRILMHPGVQVYYNSMSWWLQRWFIVFLLLSSSLLLLSLLLLLLLFSREKFEMLITRDGVDFGQSQCTAVRQRACDMTFVSSYCTFVRAYFHASIDSSLEDRNFRFMPAVNQMFYSWYNTFGARTSRTPPSTSPSELHTAPIASAPSPSTRTVSIWPSPPVSVECGLHIPDDLTPYSLVVFGGLWVAGLTVVTWVLVRVMVLCSDAVHPMTVCDDLCVCVFV
jgi:hypothetical protein